MRHLMLGVMIAVAASSGILGCSYRRTVRQPELTSLAQPGKTSDVVMHTTGLWRIRLAPSSHIRFRDRAGLWTDWLEADRLYVDQRGVSTPGAVRGVPARVGWRWDDVVAAEVQSISGWRTLGGFLGTLAVSASLAPLAGAPAVPAAAAPVLGGAALSRARWGGSPLMRAVMPRTREGAPGTWRPEVIGGDAIVARPLFGDGARRRAVARLVVAADVAMPIGLGDVDRLIDGVTVAARFGELLELGGSVRHVAGRGLEREGVWSSAPAGAFYVGGHFFLDAYQRFAIPLGVELGGSSAGGYARLRAGLRVRVDDAWFVGVYPLAPTFTGNDTDDDVLPRWSFPTAVEVGASF